MARDSTDPPRVVADSQEGAATLRLQGRWTVAESSALEAQLTAPLPRAGAAVTLDASRITALDTAGAMVLAQLEKRLRDRGGSVHVVSLSEQRAPLLKLVESQPPQEAPPAPGGAAPLIRFYRTMTGHAFAFLSFVGDVFLVSCRQLAHPHRIRWGLVLRTLQTGGADAIPIIGLLSFLIGVVIAYQGATQLHRYGADIFVVDLVGLSVVRELAPLMTALIVAGRTGSAYTAQIGTMRVTEEVDALQVLALNPLEVLVVPKLIALVITLPLLTAFADVVGVLGGMLMTAKMTSIGPAFFLSQFPRVVPSQSYVVGLGKAPVFAVVVAIVGCYQGFQVSGSAESVGRHTTTSVVQSLFLIIVLDALFSIAFSIVGI